MTHPAHFYKFCSAKVAKLMLANQRVRWSSPRLYNDPFDCYFSMELKFSLRRAAREFARRFLELIYEKEPPPFDPTNRFAMNILPFYQLARTTSPEVMKSRIPNVMALCERLWEEPRAHARSEWEARVKSYRLFCVCEHHDNVLLWSHYADCHRGVAFEVDGSAERGIPLRAAIPVTYSRDAPSLHTAKEWIDVALGLIPMADGADVWKRLVTTKARAWAYEKEWRIILHRPPEHNGAHVDLPFEPRNVTKLFLGCKISPRYRNTILRLMAGAFSHVEIYQAAQIPTKFALKFERIR